MDRWSFVAIGTRVTAAAALLGCGGSWHVVNQAASDPLAGQARFAVLPVDYSNVRVGGKAEQDYLEGRDPKEPTSFADDKASLAEGFTQALRERAGAQGISVVRGDGGAEAPFVIWPSVATLDPGVFVSSRSSQVDMDVKILASDGRVLDEITLSHGTDPRSGASAGGYGTPANASIGRRLRADGEALGTLVAQYLEERVGTVSHVEGDSQASEPAPADSSEPAPPAKPRSVSERGSAPKPSVPPPAAPSPAAEAPPAPPPPVKGKQVPRAVKRPVTAPRSKRLADASPLPPPGTPIATSPEFSRLDDGKSRIWVEVSRNVDVAESRSPGRVVYRLRGAAVLQRSDQLPLQTGYFTTPVERVQIVPDGSDVDLVVLLREEVVPSYRVVLTPRGGMVLQVDFPRATSFGREEPLPEAERGRPRARRGMTPQTLRHTKEVGEESPPPMDDN